MFLFQGGSDVSLTIYSRGCVEQADVEQFQLDDQMNSCASEENVNEDFLAAFEESGFVSLWTNIYILQTYIYNL